MRPRPTDVLAFLAETLPGHAREVQSPYLRKQLAIAATLLDMIAQDIERLVPRLIEEAKAIRGIFAQATPLVDAQDLAAAIAMEADRQCEDLHLSALFAENDRLRGLLIRVHEHVETLPGDNARALDEAIWHELAQQNERRRTSFLKG